MAQDVKPGQDPQESRFRALIVTNPVIAAIIDRLPRLSLPDCWLTASSLTQTVWNVLDGNPPEAGIHDYDVFYFDPDLSWDAEDRAIKRAAALFADIPAKIEVRNQARVHLWFDKRNGTLGYPQLKSACEGIDVFLETPTMYGIRPLGDGKFDVYAPLGYGDLFGFVFRPNPRAVGPAERYAAKAQQRLESYPRLTVINWCEKQAIAPCSDV
ncbi:MAG: nucleotidyltransferase family protein [Pseudomonadota bacterium]